MSPSLRRILRAAAVVAFVMSSTWARSEPVFSLVDKNMVLEPGASEGTAALVLQAQGIKVSDTLVRVVDGGVPQPPAITVDFTSKEIDRKETTGQWLLTAKIAGVPRGTQPCESRNHPAWARFQGGSQHPSDDSGGFATSDGGSRAWCNARAFDIGQRPFAWFGLGWVAPGVRGYAGEIGYERRIGSEDQAQEA